MINFSLPIIFTAHPLARQTLDVASEDCADLMQAVSERLRSTADQGFVSNFVGHLCTQATPTYKSILECAAALDQIGKTVSYEMTIRKTLELEIRTLRAELRQHAAQPFLPCASS
jgi:hypothetical protein